MTGSNSVRSLWNDLELLCLTSVVVTGDAEDCCVRYQAPAGSRNLPMPGGVSAASTSVKRGTTWNAGLKWQSMSC